MGEERSDMSEEKMQGGGETGRNILRTLYAAFHFLPASTPPCNLQLRAMRDTR